MKIGMPALTEFSDIASQIKICNELGLNLIELNLNYPYCDLENNNLEEIRQLAENNNVAFSIHYDEYANFASFQKEIRNAWIEHFKKTVILAKQINAIRITIHLFEGVHVTLPDKIIYVNDVYYQKYIEILTQSLTICFDFAKNHGIDLCIENVSMPPFMIETFKHLFSNQFHFTYDVGHHFEFGFKALPLYQKNWPQVKHMHLHDVIGTSPHKPLGSGTLNVSEMLEIANQYQIDIILEVKDLDALKASCAYLRKIKPRVND